MSEYIYYTITGYNTIKFGGSSNIINRQKAHYTSSPYLSMHTYKVNDAYRAEKALHKYASKYRLKPGDRINNITINNITQIHEHYNMTEDNAKQICQYIQNKFHVNKMLDSDRINCEKCLRVVNKTTTNKYDNKCKRCYDKELKNNYVKNIMIYNAGLPYTQDELNEMYTCYQYGDSYDYNDDFIDDNMDYEIS